MNTSPPSPMPADKPSAMCPTCGSELRRDETNPPTWRCENVGCSNMVAYKQPPVPTPLPADKAGAETGDTPFQAEHWTEESFTKHVGAETFTEAINVTLRQHFEHCCAREENHNTIKAQAREIAALHESEQAGTEREIRMDSELATLRADHQRQVDVIAGLEARVADEKLEVEYQRGLAEVAKASLASASAERDEAREQLQDARVEAASLRQEIGRIYE